MKKKNIIIIAVVAAVCIAALIVALRGSRKATFKQDYHIEDTSTITRIFLADKQDGEVLLTRVGDSTWMVDNDHLANQPMVKQAPVVLTICADFRRTTRWCEERKAQPGYNNFLSYQNAAIDALLYTQTLCNLMDEEGLGYCYLGTTVYQPQQIIDTLELPQLVMPVATLTVGWPAEEPPLTDRLPMESFVHEETYHDYTSQDIDKYYHEKENLEENRHFCEINHKETLAQIFTDIRYTKKDNEAMSATLLETLKKQGFID